MPNACVAPNCKTGYRSNTDHYSVFFAPKDLEERAKWQAAIPRPGFVLKERHVLCEKHFSPEEIVKEKVIKDVHGKVLLASKLKACRLVKGAVPSLFPDNSPPPSSEAMSQSEKSLVDGESRTEIFTCGDDQNLMDGTSEVSSDSSETLIQPFHKPQSPQDYMLEPSVFELLLIDENSLSIPMTWARNIPLFGPRVIIYTQLITRKVKSRIKPVFLKEVCVQENGCVHCSVIGRQLKKEHFVVPEGPLTSCEQLNGLIMLLDSLQVCEGIEGKEVVAHERQVCVLDSLGKWRHKNCLLVPKKYDSCSVCYKVMSSWKRKQLRHRIKLS